MKNVVIGLVALGICSLGFSQETEIETNGDVDQVELKGVTVKPLNLTYLQKVQDEHTPERVKKLENEAARYDVRDSPVFNGDFEAYEVVFQQSNGGIVATYDQAGTITSSLERFTDLTLPYHIRNAIYRDYPGWTIHKDAYLVSYYKDMETVDKIYKVQVRNGKSKKNVKYDSEGNRI